MNNYIQNILVVLALAAAIGFLVKKFFFKKPTSSKACGKDDCGCH
ncbi:MAG: FeoB-associated Cys-rich membrane protein [Flavobacteriaceae bacterium]|nr:FeoB-associated Cys-rich membrane protein [Mangrovimonas sp.]MCB0434923.1 FeoB-associated Cys-rich membrane protein [Mangrovimonas sp.]MCB0438008.1 FeoB-associated Cys-rich membrane protein [Mangrovimonas sp.]HPF97983.1 FeoB-associated Cys-rich membrane protein [Mangrovimonas sp.]